MAASKTTNKSKTASNKKTPAKRKPQVASKNQPKRSLNVNVKDKYVPTEKEIKLRAEIKLLVALAITFMLLLSNFGALSPVGDYVSYFMFGMFGFLAYIFPVVMFLGVAFLISNINNRKGVIKFSAGCVLFILMNAMIQLVFMDYDSSKSVFSYYKICGKDKIGGGIFGAIIEKFLYSVLGMIGTYIVLLLLIIIAAVIITEKSFIGGVKKGSVAVYETAKEDATKIKKTAKDYKEERAYQKKDKRMNNKVSGVAITKISDEEDADSEEDIHEIKHTKMHKAPVENAAIYTGHVELLDDENEENQVQDNSFYENSNHNNQVEDNLEYDNTNHKDSMDDDSIHEDEDGLYRPKEKIEVSTAAKNVMNRKAFSTAGAISTNTNNANANNANTNNANGVNSSNSNLNNSNNSNANNVNNVPRRQVVKNYVLPKTTLLNKNTNPNSKGNTQTLRETANKLQTILETFGVNAKVVDYCRGPSVTRYEIQLETGTRLSKITSLSDDIKLNLAATDIRIEPIPGKSTIGIEVPNEGRDTVLIRELIESKELMGSPSKIAFAAGKDIAGSVVVGDIAKMPHMLVAGTTGSGKSVFTNSIIMSILFRAKPSEVRLIIVDPKVVEFGVYNGIPHLLQPVVTDPKLASNTLKWAVNEMSERYKKFADFNVRDLKGYNEKVSTLGSEMGLTKIPQIVIVIDELADLMMVAAKEVEESICRLAQLARAAGIHLIIATQRPSVDVVTGLIKANIPSRCALMVSSGVDSRTIIDSNGAEKLLGNGDMLFYPSGYVKPVRLQGAFVSDAEVRRVVDFWKAQAGDVSYDDSISNYVAASYSGGFSSDSSDDRDDYFFEAAKFVIEKEKASTSMLQRMFKIGFNRAARIMDQLCDAGVVGDEEGTKPRKVLITLEELEQLKG